MARRPALVLVMVMMAWSLAAGNFVNFMSIQMEELVRTEPNIPQVAKNLGLTTLLSKVVEAGLAGGLSTGTLTLFGPTNDAFTKLPAWLDKALQNKTVLTEVLEYHVLDSKVFSNDISDELTVSNTLLGKPIRFNEYDNGQVTAQCSPIDLKRVDQMASNGVVHVLQRVMVPPSGSIVDAAVLCPAFSTLVTALKAADLVEVLAGAGPFTVFAPTNAAFAKIPQETLNNLLANKTELTAVLTYHVLKLTYCSAGLVGYPSLQTLNGQNVTIAVNGGTVNINNAKVVSADGSVTNGVIHAIDTVLLPPSLRWRL